MGAIQGAEQLHNGLTQVQAGLNGDSGLVSGLAQYTNGTSQLKAGSGQLTDGLTTLNGKVPTLTSGVTKLADGANKINAGVSTLNVKLNDGAKQVQQLNDSPANVNHFVAPVTSKVQQDSLDRPIISLFTPLVLLLTLFVGAIILELTLNRYSGEFGGFSLRRKLIGIGAATLLQSLATMLLLALMGIPMAHPLALFVILVLAIISFTTITFAFDRYLGTPGVLFTLLLVFIQLILSGGLLPNAMLAKVHQFLGAFMPGTYVLNGLNYALNGLDYSFILAVSVLLIFTAAFIILAFLPDYRARHKAKTA